MQDLVGKSPLKKIEIKKIANEKIINKRINVNVFLNLIEIQNLKKVKK